LSKQGLLQAAAAQAGRLQLNTLLSDMSEPVQRSCSSYRSSNASHWREAEQRELKFLRW
jgi:hypothetical protein